MKICGEQIADILVKSPKSLKGINCPTKLNSSAIDEFLLIFLVSAKSKGISHFKGISELRHKESDRLKIASNLLRMVGIKIYEKKDSLKMKHVEFMYWIPGSMWLGLKTIIFLSLI